MKANNTAVFLRRNPIVCFGLWYHTWNRVCIS